MNLQFSKMLKLVFLILSLILINGKSVVAASSNQVQFPVTKYKLNNGLTVLLHQDRSIPLVSFNVWYRVGSRNEEKNYTGLAHLFEHMMFKGAKRYKNKEYDRILQANGGVNNAFTSRDYTGYYINLPSSKLELAIDMESDRMEFLQVNEENLKSEREVVKEERRYRVDNNVMGALYEAIFSTVFVRHPYKNPVIGYMKDLDNINVKKSEEFYRTYYSPNNAVVVVSGDFKESTAKSLIKKYFGHMKPQKIPELKLDMEKAQRGLRSKTLKKQVQNEYMSFSFQSPKLGDRESFALDILSDILAKGTSSRLHKRLVYKSQLASSVNAFNYTPQDHGVFSVIASLKPNADRNTAKKIVLSELYRARNQKYTNEEIEKAKVSILLDHINQLKTVSGKAYMLALNEVVRGDYKMLFSDLDIYNSITAEDILKAAQKYLVPSNRTEILVVPN